MEMDGANAQTLRSGGLASDASCPHNEIAWAVAADVAAVLVPLLTVVGLPNIVRSAAPENSKAHAEEGFRDELRVVKEGLSRGVEGGATVLFDAFASALLWLWEATKAAVIGSPAVVPSCEGSLDAGPRCTWSTRRGVIAQLLEENVPSPTVCQQHNPAELPAEKAVRKGLGGLRTELGALGSELEFSMQVLVVVLQTYALEHLCLTVDGAAHLNKVLCTAADSVLDRL